VVRSPREAGGAVVVVVGAGEPVVALDDVDDVDEGTVATG
jgi:hypothetical protein